MPECARAANKPCAGVFSSSKLKFMADTLIKIYEYKLRTNKSFVREAERTLISCQRLYNACLEQRISHYTYARKSVSWIEQSRELTELRAADAGFAQVSRAFQQETLKRLEKAYDGFFKRLKKGEKAGFPRFRAKERYNSFEWPIDQRKQGPLRGDKIHVPSVGSCRVRLSRPLEGKAKHARILRRADGWYVQLVCELAKPAPLPKTGKKVGVDVGLSSFAALSTGELIENPRTLKRNEEKLAEAARKVARRKKSGQRRRKAVKLLAKQHLRVQRARKHFHFQVANRLVKEFDEIHVEELKIKNMVKNRSLAKAISDVAWGNFFLIAQFKAACAGREFKKKIARYTSQTCSTCGHRQKMPLWLRVFFCEKCEHGENRDTNAGKNILGAEIAPQMKKSENAKWRKRSAALKECSESPSLPARI